jgi:PAP2 superfamily
MLVASCVGLVSVSVADQDPVLHWNQVILNTIRENGGAPGPISRDIAIALVSMHDAVASIHGQYDTYAPRIACSPQASREAAAATAAANTLGTLHPWFVPIYEQELAIDLALIPNGPAKDEGIAVGLAAAKQILAMRASDGWDTSIIHVESGLPGDWERTWPDWTPPITPQWAFVKPWTMSACDQFRPSPESLPALDSPEYAANVNEVMLLGELNSPARTAEETVIAHFWANDFYGTYKPPGHLLEITEIVSKDQGLSFEQNARLFALVALSMADAAIASWDTKYATDRDLWRPISAIRRADEDGNLLTTKKENWEPLSPKTPAFPAFVSGHAAFGATHAAVMRAFFGTDAITFTCTSDDAPGVWRTFNSFTQAAHENGRSRVYLGVHYQFDADIGYEIGTNIGKQVAAQFLRPTCPADCDESSSLSIDDFICFQTRFVLGLTLADCDTDGTLTIDDFICFQTAFVLGC